MIPIISGCRVTASVPPRTPCRHFDVQDHQVGTGARDHLEGFDPSCRRLDDVAVPEALKVLAESVEKVWIVVNDQDPGARGQCNHRDTPGGLVGPQTLGNRRPVHYGHVMVDEDQVGTLRASQTQTLRTAEAREA